MRALKISTLALATLIAAPMERTFAQREGTDVTIQVRQHASEGRSHWTRRTERAVILLDCSADETLCADLTDALHESFPGVVIRRAPWGTMDDLPPAPPGSMSVRLDLTETNGQAAAKLIASEGADHPQNETAILMRNADGAPGLGGVAP